MFKKLFSRNTSDGDETKESVPCKGDKRRIIEFSRVTLERSGMRFIEEFELTADGEKTKAVRYNLVFRNGEKAREPIAEATLDTKDVVEMLNKCRLLSWDGFYGKHPKGVLDGTMFTLEAVVNGDRKISAHGSQNFPKKYSDLTQWLYELFV